jgi:PAS domain S-box-containing protein
MTPTTLPGRPFREGPVPLPLPPSVPRPDAEILQKLVLEQLPAIFWSVDRRLRVTSSIGAGLGGLGLAPHQTVGLSLFELFQTKDPSSPILVNHRRALAGEKVVYELEWRGRALHSRVEPLRGSDGSVIGAVGMSLDITQRKRAEAALQDSEARWRAVLTQAPYHIILLDPEGRIEYINRVEHDDSPEAVVGRSTIDFLLPAYRAVARNAYRRALDEGEFVTFDGRVRLTGGIRWLHHRVGPLVRNGRVNGLILIAVDITDQKKAQDALRASYSKMRKLAAKLESVREEERRRIALDIHDRLGQALTVVKLNVSSLAPEGAAGSEYRRKLRSVSQSLDEAIRAVREISNDLRPPVLDSLGLKATIEWQTRDFAKRTGVACDIRLPDGELSLDSDRSTAVFRIFQEILTNVVRHARARQVNVALDRDAAGLKLTVSDDGRGITPKALAHPSSLGLLGMRERAAAFGGTVDIRRRKPRGTRVTVSIPAAAKPPRRRAR